MKRVLATLLFIVLLGCTTHTRIDPVQPLQFRGETYCTSWSVNEQEGYWASAAHCAIAAKMLTEATKGEQSTIDGKQAVVIYIDRFTDTAIFQADAHAEAFRLAKERADVGQAVVIIGFPFGLARARTTGSMAIQNLLLFHPVFEDYVLSDVLDITTAPGNSGSPVLNQRGEVVGLLWGGFSGVGLSITVPLDSLRTSIGRFFSPR